VPSCACIVRPMVGSAIPTTVASMAATPDPITVAAMTHRPGADRYSSASATPWTVTGSGRAALVVAR